MKSGRKPSKYRMVSPKLCGTKCVELFYFTNKFDKSELRLSARKDEGEDRVWFESELGKKTDDWTRAVVEIKAEEETCFKVIIHSFWLIRHVFHLTVCPQTRIKKSIKQK